jgi:acylphosphatase
VRNRADGSVEVRLRGPAAVVDQMRALLAAGPPGASVGAVEEIDPGSIPTGEFRIDR